MSNSIGGSGDSQGAFAVFTALQVSTSWTPTIHAYHHCCQIAITRATRTLWLSAEGIATAIPSTIAWSLAQWKQNLCMQHPNPFSHLHPWCIEIEWAVQFDCIYLKFMFDCSLLYLHDHLMFLCFQITFLGISETVGKTFVIAAQLLLTLLLTRAW